MRGTDFQHPPERPRLIDAADDVLTARALEATSLAAWCLDTERRIRFVNAAAAAVTGHRPDDLVGKPVEELWPTERIDDYRARLDEARAGESVHHEAHLCRAGGDTIMVGLSWSAVLDDAGTHTGYVGIGRDITERKAMEQALRRGMDSFRRLVERSEEGMFLIALEPERRLTYLNPAAERSLGYRQQDFELDPNLWRDRVHPDDRNAVMARVRSTPPVDESLRFRWARPDGHWVELRLRELLALDIVERPTFVGIIHDLTDARRRRSALENALGREREASRRLRRIDEVRRTFLQAVSHELRTPLTSVVGFARTLEDRQEQLTEDQVAAMLRRIVRNANRLQDLLDDLLDVDRLSRGALSLERTPTDLGELAHRVVDHVAPNADWIDVQTVPLNLVVDEGKMERVLENLVRNAVKHAGDDVLIRVRVRRNDHDAIITVADNGVGIPDAYKEIIFEPFERGPAARRGVPGTGIGLTLVRELIRLHGGEVTIDDAEGGGTVVTLRVPLSPPEETEADRTTAVAEG